jgi:hypothetical protein
MAFGLDVEPTGARAIGAGFSEPGPRLADKARPREGARSDKRDDHALIGWYAQEADASVELVEVIDRRRAKEGPSRRPCQWAYWLL